MRRESQACRLPIGFRFAPWRTLFPVLAWTECCICRLEVRRERMWKAIPGPWIGGRGNERYACQSCAPLNASEQEVADRIQKAITPQVSLFGPHAFPPRPPTSRREGTTVLEQRRDASA